MSEKETNEMTTFAELFEAHSEMPKKKFFPGDKISGMIVKISKDTVFVDLGGKSEGVVGTEEFLDKEGNLTVKEGQQIELRIASTQDGIHLTKGIRVQGAEAVDLLREAQQNQVPVEGKVAAAIKGGFEIDLSGVRAFCPISQIELRFCEKPEQHVGQKYLFRVMEIKERGRNVVVSRRALLQEEQEKKSKETLASLRPGLEVEGKVTKLTEFGAFVDLGGIEGMVHVSEISHARIGRPSEVLKTGQTVKVKVLKMEPDKAGRQRIALSLKALEPDAWEKGLPFKEGDILPGKISKVADYGAFVEVAPGVDGLVHISEMSYERVNDPRTVVKEGETIDVLVLGIDLRSRRISLSIKEAAAKKWIAGQGGEERAQLEIGAVIKGIVDNTKNYGVFVRLPQLGMGVRGLLPVEEIRDSEKGDLKKKFPQGRELQVEIVAIDEEGRIRLSQRSIKDREDRADYEKFVEKQERRENLGTFGELLKDFKVSNE
jgi:small subunit ribosomal protein S1